MGVIVYGLSSSAKPQAIRYIGQSHFPAEVRLKQHLKVISKARHPVHFWMCRVIGFGHKVVITVLVEGAVRNIDEKRLIAEYRENGYSLLNRTVGGGGAPGFKHSPAEKARRSDRMTGKTLSQEIRAKISNTLKGRELPAAFRAMISVPKFGESNAFYGKTHSAASRHANGKARAKLTDEQVRQARELRAQGWTQIRIASHIGISQAQVSALLNGLSYDWVR